MMHGREKSDPAIVAVKPPNGAGLLAEEGVERRAGAEGTRARTARAGLRTGKACPRGWTAYGTLHAHGRRNGSPRSSTTSPPTGSGWLSSPSGEGLLPASTG
jgi:hypothetical protein